MSLWDHLPVLVVIVPLMAGPLCVLVERPRAAWGVALAAAWLSFAAAVALAVQVSDTGTISYELGGWAPPWGIEYRIDTLGSYVLLIVTAIAALVMVAAKESVAREVPEPLIARFYAALMLAFAGLVGIVATGDAFNVFVFLEISSLASYALIGMGRDRRALTSAFDYLVMGTIGATFILIGIGFLYMMTGTLNMQDLAARLPEVWDTRTVRAGFAFLTVGIGLKLAMFPLHLWLPNAYTYAPSVVTAFLAATATKVAVYVLLRFMLGIFGIDFALGRMPFEYILLPVGCAWHPVRLAGGHLPGGGQASAGLFQRRADRLHGAGYRSGQHHGDHRCHPAPVQPRADEGRPVSRAGRRRLPPGLHDAAGSGGLGRRMPWTMFAIVVGGLSLIGVPGTVGFVSKWYLVLASLEQGLWPVALLILLGSLLAVVYVWKLVEAAYLTEPQGEVAVQEAPLSMLVPLWLLVIANVYFGVHTEVSVGLARQAAAVLTGGAG